MAGAGPKHVLIVTNVVNELRMQLKRGPCTVYSTDLRVKVSPIRRTGIVEKIHVQKDGNKAKPYQVQQVRQVLLKYQLGGESR